MREKHEIPLSFYNEDGETTIVVVKLYVEHDEGVWRDSNGEGYPPTTDYDWYVSYVYSENDKDNHTKILPDWIDIGELDEMVESYIEEHEL